MQIERHILYTYSNFVPAGLYLCGCSVTITDNDEDDSKEI